MGTIVKRKEAGPIAPTVGEWDPFRMMREMFHWDPFREMFPLAAEEAFTYAPHFEVKETKESYVFKADLPGVKEADLDIALTGNRLTVSGKREAERHEETDTFYTRERSFGSFTRAFTLPEGIDPEHVQAELKSGVLNIVLPKLPEAQPKKIEVRPGAEKAQA